jgi:hypothetical protein
MTLKIVKQIALATTFGILLNLCLATLAQADTIYQYTGNSYDPADCEGAYCSGGPYHLSITVDVSAPVGALDNLTQFGPLFLGSLSPFVQSFSFSDGLEFLSSANPDEAGGYFDVQTDSSGNIVAWDAHLESDTGSVAFISLNDPGFVYDSGGTPGASSVSFGSNMNDPGTWTMTTTAPASTPEPDSLLLVIAGGASALLLMRKKRGVQFRI